MKYRIQGLRKSHLILFNIQPNSKVLALVYFAQHKKERSPPSGHQGHCAVALTYLQNPLEISFGAPGQRKQRLWRTVSLGVPEQRCACPLCNVDLYGAEWVRLLGGQMVRRGNCFFLFYLTLTTADQVWIGMGIAFLAEASVREGLSLLPALGRTPNCPSLPLELGLKL